jgi:ATP-dependent RNA helicase TDRD9
MDDDVLGGSDLMAMMMDSFAGSSSQRIVAPKPMNTFVCKAEIKEEIPSYEREKGGTDYAARYQQKEEQMLITKALNLPSISVDDDDDGMRISKGLEQQEMPEKDVFKRYQFNLIPQALPILNKREEILQKIDRNSVVVLTASTGTGKSSQVPQYIIEQAFKRNAKCNIIVTQPRRIAGKFVLKTS